MDFFNIDWRALGWTLVYMFVYILGFYQGSEYEKDQRRKARKKKKSRHNRRNDDGQGLQK